MPDLALLRRLAEQHGVPAADVDGAMGRPHPRTALLELLESATTPDQATNVDNYTEMRASSNPLALAPPDVAMEHCLIFRSGAAAIDVGVDILGGSDDSSSNSGGDDNDNGMPSRCDIWSSDDSDNGIFIVGGDAHARRIQAQSNDDPDRQAWLQARANEDFEKGEARFREAMRDIRFELEVIGLSSALERWEKEGRYRDLDTRVENGPDNDVTLELRQLRQQIDAAIKRRTKKRAVTLLVTCLLTLMWGAHWIYTKTPAYLWSRVDCQLSIVKDALVERKGGEGHFVQCALGEATLPNGEKVQFPLKDAATIANCHAGLSPKPGTNETTPIECWQREWQNGILSPEYHEKWGVWQANLLPPWGKCWYNCDDHRARTADGSLPKDGPVCFQNSRPTYGLPLLASFGDIYCLWWTLPSIAAVCSLPCFCSGNLKRCKSRCKDIKSRHTQTGASGLDSSALLQEASPTSDVPPSTNRAPPPSLSARLFWVRSTRSFICWAGWWVLALLCIVTVLRSCWMLSGLVQPAQCEPVAFHRHVLDKSNVTECRWDFRVTTTVDSYPYPLLVGTWTALAKDVEPKVGDLGRDCRPKATMGNISCFYQSEPSDDGSKLDNTRCNMVPSAPSFEDDCRNRWKDDDRLHNCMHVVRFSEGVPLDGRVGHLCRYSEEFDKAIIGLVLPCLVLYRLILWQQRHKLLARKISLFTAIGVYPIVVIFHLWPDGYDIAQIIVFLTCCYVGSILAGIVCMEGCRYLQGRPLMVTDEQDEAEDRRRQEEFADAMDGMVVAM